MTHKYKIGDKVRLVESFPNCGISKGEYVISGLSYQAECYFLSENKIAVHSQYLSLVKSEIYFTNKEGDRRKLLGQAEDVYFLSKKNDFDRMGKVYTLKDLDVLGYK